MFTLEESMQAFIPNRHARESNVRKLRKCGHERFIAITASIHARIALPSLWFLDNKGTRHTIQIIMTLASGSLRLLRFGSLQKTGSRLPPLLPFGSACEAH